MPTGSYLLLEGSARQHPLNLYTCEIMKNTRDAAGRGGIPRPLPGVHLQGGLQGKEVLEGQKLQGVVHRSEMAGQLPGVHPKDLLNGAPFHQLQKQAFRSYLCPTTGFIELVGAQSLVDIQPNLNGLAYIGAGHGAALASLITFWYPCGMKSEEELFREALERGITLFNEGRYMEAYEVWETRWSEDLTDGTELLQGLLQISVGLAKLEGGNPRGTLKLLERGMELLQPYGPEAYDIDIDALLGVVSSFREQAAALIAAGNEGGNTVVSTEGQSEWPKEETPRAPWWKRFLRRT